jgi:hypothetical protein
MNIEIVKEALPDRIYAVDFVPGEFPVFSEWFSHLSETDLSVKVNGELYRFRTGQEKAMFCYGMSQMLRIKNKSGLIDRLKSEIKEADKKIWGMLSSLKPN